MKLRGLIAGAATLFMVAGGVAHAGQYDAEVLGQALPMWMETLASINDDGDVAWTAWGGNTTTAKFFRDGQPHDLTSSQNDSWAVSISERVQDGSDTVVGVAGSEASSQRLTDRSALLWEVRWASNGAPASTRIDLGAVTDKLEDGKEGTVQQSAAYGVLARQGAANRYYVGGFARDKVNSQTFPQPVIWTVGDAGTANPSISQDTLPLIHPSATHGSGYVAGIAQNGNKIWACGNSTGDNAYNQATCWDISAGPGSATVYNQLNTDLISSNGFSGNVVSSMIHRVRTVPIGPNGASHTVAVGAALVGSGGSHQWKGFVYDLDGSSGDRLYKDLNLTSENETLAYDVAALTYVGNDNGVQTTSHGMIIAGISSTASPAELGGLEGGPVDADTTKMTGVNRRMTLSGITDDGQVCAINDDSELVTAGYDQLLALSPEGDHRLAMANGELVRLTAMPSGATLEIRNRDATERKHHYVSRSPVQYHQMQALLTSPAHAAIVRFANALGCDALDGSDLGTCDNPAAFELGDNSNELDVLLDQVIGVATPSTTVRSDVESGLFDPTDYTYAQIAQRDGSDCTITPVYASTTQEVDVQTNPAQDFDGMIWQECNGVWVDPQTDYEHCSDCGQEAVVTGQSALNSRPLSQCLWGQCKNGVVQPEENESHRYKTDTCYIEDTCWTNSEQRPIPNTGAETASNFCQQCQSSYSQTTWETYPNTTCCDANAEPQMSGWHNDYRPTGNNVVYSGANLISPWIRRISEVTDAGLWADWISDGVFSCGGIQCSENPSPTRVQKLTSNLSEADQEDWFVFHHRDAGPGKTYPRVRVKPTTAKQIDLCVFPRCTDNLNSAQRNGWAQSLMSNINGTEHGRTRALEGGTPTYVSPANSPLKEDGIGLAGACTSSTANGGAVDLAIIVEDYNSGAPNQCWNMDWFVQVTAKEAPSSMICEDEYQLFWGNWMTKAKCTFNSSEYGPDEMRDNWGNYRNICDNSGIPQFHSP